MPSCMELKFYEFYTVALHLILFSCANSCRKKSYAWKGHKKYYIDVYEKVGYGKAKAELHENCSQSSRV